MVARERGEREPKGSEDPRLQSVALDSCYLPLLLLFFLFLIFTAFVL